MSNFQSCPAGGSPSKKSPQESIVRAEWTEGDAPLRPRASMLRRRSNGAVAPRSRLLSVVCQRHSDQTECFERYQTRTSHLWPLAPRGVAESEILALKSRRRPTREEGNRHPVFCADP